MNSKKKKQKNIGLFTALFSITLGLALACPSGGGGSSDGGGSGGGGGSGCNVGDFALNITNNTAGDIIISWTDPTQSNFESVTIQRSIVGISSTQSDTVNKGVQKLEIQASELSGTLESEHMFTATLNCADGIMSEAAAPITYTIDKTAPTNLGNFMAVPAPGGVIDLSWMTPTDSDYSHATITWTPNAPSEPMRVEASQTSLRQIFSIDGNITFTYQSYDNIGNTQGSPLMVTAVSDRSPPTQITLSGANIINLADGSIRVSYTEPTTGGSNPDYSHAIITYGTVGQASQERRVNRDAMNGATRIEDFLNLTVGTQYDFGIVSVDMVGNRSSTVTVRRASALGNIVIIQGTQLTPYNDSVPGSVTETYFNNCANLLANSSNAGFARLRDLRYSKAVLFGSVPASSGLDRYQYKDIATDSNAIGRDGNISVYSGTSIVTVTDQFRVSGTTASRTLATLIGSNPQNNGNPTFTAIMTVAAGSATNPFRTFTNLGTRTFGGEACVDRDGISGYDFAASGTGGASRAWTANGSQSNPQCLSANPGYTSRYFCVVR